MYIIGINRILPFTIFDTVMFQLLISFEPPIKVFKTVFSSCLWLNVCVLTSCLEKPSILISIFQAIVSFGSILISVIQVHKPSWWSVLIHHFSESTSDPQPVPGSPLTTLEILFLSFIFSLTTLALLCVLQLSLVGSPSLLFALFSVYSHMRGEQKWWRCKGHHPTQSGSLPHLEKLSSRSV